MKIEISNGELLDKVSIVKLKMEYIGDTEKLKHLRKENNVLVSHMMELTESLGDKEAEAKYLGLYDQLYAVNENLWHLEDRIRDKERRNVFDQDFIEIARSIYYVNDERAKLKRQINELTQSSLYEVKSYQEYQ